MLDTLLFVSVVVLFFIVADQREDIAALEKRLNNKESLNVNPLKPLWESINTLTQQMSVLAGHIGVVLRYESGWVVRKPGEGASGYNPNSANVGHAPGGQSGSITSH